METRELNSISDDLVKYDHLAKIDDFIQITEWANGEGYDISINDRMFNLTEGQLNAINYLVQTLRYGGK